MNSNGLQMVKLSEIADVRDGTHDSPKESDIGKPLVTSKNIKNGKIDLTNTYLISFDDFESVNRRSKVDKWDILFSMIGTIGEMSIVDFEPDFAIKNVGLFKTNDFEISKWIYYYLKSPEAQNEIKANLKGTTQQYISLTDLRNFPIDLPPKARRIRISEILSSIDNKIENNLATNQTLEEIAKTLFKEWFVNFNYQNADGQRKHSAFGEIPSEWEVVGVSSLFEVKDGTHDSPKSKIEGKHLITSKHLKSDGMIDFESAYRISISDFENINKRSKVENLDILYSMIGTIGNILLVNENPVDFAIKNIGLFKTSQRVDLAYFMFLYLKSNFAIQYLLQRQSGSTQQYLTLKSLREIPIILPSGDVVEKFNKIIVPIFEMIKSKNHQNETLKTLRDNLLPKLMSREIPINISN